MLEEIDVLCFSLGFCRVSGGIHSPQLFFLAQHPYRIAIFLPATMRAEGNDTEHCGMCVVSVCFFAEPTASCGFPMQFIATTLLWPVGAINNAL